ncbi:MAG: PQQ enzyme repeat protein [Methanomassiliicoccales archaeon PtaU1.Bin124]|nr:MAG: PQQ enzyme repeat protein [Methanomassiliicoccales archaeon PtaU1.Bin124]
MRKWSWRPANVILVVILVVSLIACAFLASHQITTGGIQAKYTFSDAEVGTTDDNTYRVLAADDNGTVYISEALATWVPPAQRACLISLDVNGDARWRIGTNVMLQELTIGCDGNLYCVDLTNSSDWQSETLVFNNLTAYDVHGHRLWNYISNGSLSIWGVFPDGTMIVERNGSMLMGIRNGTVLWERGLVDYPFTFLDHSVFLNDTMVVLSYDDDQSSALALNEDGEVVWSVPLGSRPYFVSSMCGNITYEMFEEWSGSTAVTCVVALNITDGSLLWETILDQHEAMQPGLNYTGSVAYVDGKGVVYAHHNGTLYALASNGELLWKKVSVQTPRAAFETGGVLVGNETILKRIDPEGNVIWQYVSERPLPDQSIAVGKDVVYVAGGNKMMALSQFTISGDISLILVIISFDILAIISYIIWHKPVKT